MREMQNFLVKHTFNDAKPRGRFGRLMPVSRVDRRLLMRCSPGSVGGRVTAEHIAQIASHLRDRAESLAADLNRATEIAGITNDIGRAMFLAQVLHEIGTKSDLYEDGGKMRYEDKVYDYFFFMYDKDSPSKSKQKVAKNLGNTEPGDGARFHGRGYIQLTGRRNYRRAGADLNLDLIGNPDLAVEPSNAIRIAGWFWRNGNGDLNQFTRKDTSDNFDTVTKRINGGLTHIERRRELYTRAKQALGVN